MEGLDGERTNDRGRGLSCDKHFICHTEFHADEAADGGAAGRRAAVGGEVGRGKRNFSPSSDCKCEFVICPGIAQIGEWYGNEKRDGEENREPGQRPKLKTDPGSKQTVGSRLQSRT
ncbi:hypothetical protein EVAR_55186_1 [Eumeta japonica]|uniref:Uncharacterized protein n=1 Tax=Eumeta variegata TaxID=151549 RepID=A0A4C1Y714_EUMVA|nr:hypothetical protein EVAR_55186_1 [Eumeta japonica]